MSYMLQLTLLLVLLSTYVRVTRKTMWKKKQRNPNQKLFRQEGQIILLPISVELLLFFQGCK